MTLVGGTKLREEEEVIVRSRRRRDQRGEWTGTGQRGLIRSLTERWMSSCEQFGEYLTV